MAPAEPQEQFRHNIHDGNVGHFDDEENLDNDHHEHHEQTEEELDERTSLLPSRAQKVRHTFNDTAHNIFLFFPPRVRRGIGSMDSPFLDIIFICIALGLVLGLVPKLHRAFFAPYEDGGIFNAWLITSIENVGGLFTTLQVFLVGCKLGVGFERMKRSGDEGRVPIRAALVVFFVRLILWPVYVLTISLSPPPLFKLTNWTHSHLPLRMSIIGLYYFICHVKIFPNDPVLWFTMMVMPTGPPALIISGLAELSNQVTKSEKLAIAKVLAVCLFYPPRTFPPLFWRISSLGGRERLTIIDQPKQKQNR